MLDKSADVPQRHLRHPRIPVSGKQRLATLPQRLVSVHTAAIVLENRLRHERHRLAILIGNILDDVLVEHHVISRPHQRIELQVNLGLAAGCHFVMVTFHFQPAGLHGHDHLTAQVLIVVRRRHREISFLITRTISLVILHPSRIPTSLFRIDKVKPVLLALIEAHIVKNEKFGLSAEVRGVRHSRRTQIHFCLLRNVARIAVITLLGHGIDHVAYHHQCGYFSEWIEHITVGIRNEQHVAFVDGCPPPNRRAVHAKALFKRGLRQLIDRIRNVMLQSRQVGETEIEHLNSVLLHKLQDALRVSHESLLLGCFQIL